MQAAAELLESIAGNRELLAGVPEAERTRLLQAAGRISRPDALARRQLVKATKRQRKASKSQRAEDALNQTGIRKLRRQTVFTTPNYFPPKNFQVLDIPKDADELQQRASGILPEGQIDSGPADGMTAAHAVEEENCYICKQDYSTIHHFYDQLCPRCAELNWTKRTETADLRGRVALLTGGRVKIGYQAGIKLLRAGARLIVTTRFPRDSAKRYAAEPDFKDWGHRLEIFGLDLRHTPSVEAFCKHLLATHGAFGFHHQQRLPDRAASAGFLSAHDGIGNRFAGKNAGGYAQTDRRIRRLARLSYFAGRWSAGLRPGQFDK